MQTGPTVENFVTSHVHTFVAAHALLICTVLGVWVFVGSQLGRYWPMPPTTAPKWKRFLHFVLVNWPEFGRGLEGKTWMGVEFSLPFISWTKRADEIVDAIDQARKILGEPAAAVVATKTETTTTITAAAVAAAEGTVPGTPVKPIVDDKSGPPSVIIPDPPKSDKGFISLGLLLAIAIIGFIIALAASGCAPTDAYVTAVKVKGDLSDTLYYAHEAWFVFDQAYHADLVKDADTLADGRAKLQKWEVNEKKVDEAFVIARKAVDTYSLALAATDAEQKKDFVAAITAVSAAVANLIDILRTLGVTIPGIDSVQKPVTMASNSILIASRKQLQARAADLVVAVCTEKRAKGTPYYPKRVCNYTFQERASR